METSNVAVVKNCFTRKEDLPNELKHATSGDKPEKALDKPENISDEALSHIYPYPVCIRYHSFRIN